MKECTYRLSLAELLNRPMGLVALRGSDGEPSDSGGGDPKGGEGDDKSKDLSGEPKSGDQPKEKTAEPSAEAKRITALEEEKQRFYDQREEARAEVKSLKAEISKLKREGTPDEALKTEVETTAKENTRLVAENTRLRLENAFLTENGFDWVDPKAALKLADLDSVEIDEKTGKVVGLNSALTKLAKDSPYLLKKTEKQEEDPKPDPRRTGKPPAAGSQKAADQAAREAELRRKYPALRR